MSNKENKTIDSILDKISCGDVEMKPKSYFVIRGVLWASTIVIGFLIAVFAFSFILFVLRGNGFTPLMEFGFAGLPVILRFIPWEFVVLIPLLLIVLERLSKHFAFVYKRPLVYSILGALLLVVLGGVLISQTGIHEKLVNRAFDGRLPIAGPMYKHFGEAQFGESVHVGKIKEINEKGFKIESRDGTSFDVLVSDSTRVGGFDISVDSMVMLLGSVEDDGTISALGVRPVDNKHLFMKPHPRTQGGSAGNFRAKHRPEF